MPLFADRFRSLPVPCWDLIAMYRDKIQHRTRLLDLSGNEHVADNDNISGRHYSDESNHYIDRPEESTTVGS